MSTAVLVPSNNGMPRAFKWASHHACPTQSGSTHGGTPQPSPATAAAATITCPTSSPLPTEQHAIASLESELTFTYDTLATINVMFDSLQHAYTSSQSEMERLRNPVRLSEKEKELLGAYDDLGLQVVHLERQIVKLESKLAEVKSQQVPSDSGTAAAAAAPPPPPPPPPPPVETWEATPMSSIDPLSPSPSLPTPPIVSDQQFFNHAAMIHSEPMDMGFAYQDEPTAGAAAPEFATDPVVSTPMDENPAFYFQPQDSMFFDILGDPALYNLTCYNMDLTSPPSQQDGTPAGWPL